MILDEAHNIISLLLRLLQLTQVNLTQSSIIWMAGPVCNAEQLQWFTPWQEFKQDWKYVPIRMCQPDFC